MIRVDTHEPQAFDSGLFVRMLTYIRPYLFVALLALACLLGFAIADTALITTLKRAIDEALKPTGVAAARSLEARYDVLLGLAGIYAGLALLGFLLRYAQGYSLALLGQSIARNLRHDIFAKFQRLSVAYFDQNPIGRLMTRVTSDVDAINQFLTQGLVGFAQDLFLLVVFVSAMISLDFRLALVSFSLVPVLLFGTSWLRVRLRNGFRQTSFAQAMVNANLNEQLSGMREIQLFGQEKRAYGKFSVLNNRLFRANLEVVRWNSLFFSFVALMSEFGLAITLWYGGTRTLDSAITIGTLVAMLELLRRIFTPLQDMADKFNILQAAFVSAERLFGVLDEPEVIADRANARSISHFQGDVRFEDVWFSYKTGMPEDEDWILRGINAHIKPGERVAFVGATGAGKTSLTSLISRFYDVQRGRVLVDGVDVRDYAQRDLRAHVGVVLQDVFLFSGTILENLTLFNPEIPRERVVEVCTFVGAHEFIVELPESYDTIVRERGATLSAGQKQLLACARALVHNPDIILVLDEATANVDSHTEAKIQQALERVMSGRTSIVIAHRLATIQRCDRIVVMREGRILEEGSHFELLAAGGYYAKLHRLQYAEDVA